jgi:hypothetical protein
MYALAVGKTCSCWRRGYVGVGDILGGDSPYLNIVLRSVSTPVSKSRVCT